MADVNATASRSPGIRLCGFLVWNGAPDWAHRINEL